MDQTHASSGQMLEQIWSALHADPEALAALRFEGPGELLPSVYDVTACAAASIGAATLAIAEWHAARTGRPLAAVRVDLRNAAAAFRAERYLRAVGWELPPVWDPIAGDYRTRDGWIRLHTNYSYHRDAVLRVLGVPCERECVREAVATREAEALEQEVVAEGGCAAMMRDAAQWQQHQAGCAVAGEPLIAWQLDAPLAYAPAIVRAESGLLPLSGIRVLDLTRVIAGPLCTRTLAAFGADVLRIDPPGFAEVGALLPETTLGKRRAALDLKSDAGRDAFGRLVSGAHVLVHGLRGDALSRAGFDRARLQALNPELITITHDAYGFSGPFRARRGFDSLVQMSCGIAARGMALVGAPRPTPLPAQALDHATGYLLAAATCRALLRLAHEGRPSEARLSLARTAKFLMDHGETGAPAAADFSAADAEAWLEDDVTAFGAVRRVRYPGRIEAVEPRFAHRAGPLGNDMAAW